LPITKTKTEKMVSNKTNEQDAITENEFQYEVRRHQPLTLTELTNIFKRRLVGDKKKVVLFFFLIFCIYFFF
jgi:hypothetical protein